MKEMFRIEDTLTNKISYYHIMAFMVCLPFNDFYSEMVLASFILHELIHFKKEKFSGFRFLVLLSALIYVITFASAFYSSDKDQMIVDLGKQLGLLIFPLVFSITSLNLATYRFRLMKAFGLSMLVIIIYLYFDAFNIIRYNHLPLSTLMTTAFINHNFSLPLNLHATYLAMYVTVAAAVFLQVIVTSHKWRQRLLYTIGLLILMTAIVQLSSKAVFIAALVIFYLAAFFLIHRYRNRWKFITVSFVLSLLAIAGLTKSVQFKTRFIQGLKQDLTKSSYNVNVVEPRLVRWQAAWPLVKQSPVIGHGTGSEVSLLKEEYFQKKLFISYLNQLNAHNQYLSFLIRSGIIGLAVFLFVLGVGFKQAFTLKDYIFCSFLIVVSVVSLSENILDVNKGIFFFGFFYPFFMRREPSSTYTPLPAN
ncbi:MAG: O-antigen ligase family protein [Chitinophagaceae bacterium]